MGPFTIDLKVYLCKIVARTAMMSVPTHFYQFYGWVNPQAFTCAYIVEWGILKGY